MALRGFFVAVHYGIALSFAYWHYSICNLTIQYVILIESEYVLDFSPLPCYTTNRWNPYKIRRFWYDWGTNTDRLIILTLQKRDKARGWGIFLWSEKLSESSDNGMECTVVLWSTLEYMVKKWSQMLFPKCILIHTHAYCVTFNVSSPMFV